jgi:hypothetical protein
MIFYISIGNSDDKLSQLSWSLFVGDVQKALTRHVRQIHGEWFSVTSAPYQNACWCVEIDGFRSQFALRGELARIRKAYNQDSVAWAEVPNTEFL